MATASRMASVESHRHITATINPCSPILHCTAILALRWWMGRWSVKDNLIPSVQELNQNSFRWNTLTRIASCQIENDIYNLLITTSLSKQRPQMTLKCPRIVNLVLPWRRVSQAGSGTPRKRWNRNGKVVNADGTLVVRFHVYQFSCQFIILVCQTAS